MGSFGSHLVLKFVAKIYGNGRFGRLLILEEGVGIKDWVRRGFAILQNAIAT